MYGRCCGERGGTEIERLQFGQSADFIRQAGQVVAAQIERDQGCQSADLRR